MPKPRHKKPQANRQARQQQPMRAFTFGEPEQVLSGNIGEYLGVFLSDDGEIYKPGPGQVAARQRAPRRHSQVQAQLAVA